MNHTRLWVAATIIAIFLIIGFVLSVPHTRDIEVDQTLLPTETYAPSVSLHDVFKKGTHTISGSIEVPNACTIVSATAVLTGEVSSTERILVNISVEKDVGVCLQLPTSKGFSTTIVASGGLPISATVNGETATTTVI